MGQPTHQQGWSLLELMTVMLIIASLALASSASIRSTSRRVAFEHDLSQLYHLLTQARLRAITTQQTLILCPLNRTGHCARAWSQALTLFIDKDKNSALSKDDQVISRTPALTKFKRTYPRTMVRFNSRGYAGHTNGTFRHESVEPPRPTKTLIVSRLGRIRLGKERADKAQTAKDN